MKKKSLGQLAATMLVASGVILGSSAQATSLDYSTDFGAGVGAEWTTSGSNNASGVLGQFSGGFGQLSLDAPGSGVGRLTFDLQGYATIDGYNCCTDKFQLTVNGTEIFRGVFNMGGGGTEGIELEPAGTAVVAGSNVRTISIDVTLVNGTNTFRFDYSPMQGFGDEAWAVDNVALSASNLTPVPEPETYALLLAGIGLVSAASRRKKS